MKQLFAKKRYIISTLLTFLMVFCISMSGYANVTPVFTDGDSTTRTVAENTASGTNIGDPVAATDADNDVLTYGLSGTDAGSFSIVSTTGQLQTNAALDYETKTSYSVTVSVSDDNGGRNNTTVTITVTDVGEKPAFAPGGVILSVAENTASGTNIGDPFEATDPDSGDTLTYSLQRGDKDAFRIDPNTGQLRTHAVLDYETKRFYTDLAVRATDSTGLVGSVRVTINVKDVDENRAPVFTDGSSTERTIAENTASGQNIGTAVAATDADNDTLIYTLGGDPDAASFSIVRTSGQLQTRAALDYETKASYSVTVSVSDGNGGSDSITVTIDVQDVPEITPPLSERTPQVRDAIIAKLRRVSNANDVTPAHLAAIRTLDVSNKKITALKTGDFNGLTALSTLDLGWNSIRDISALAGLTSVTELFLHANSISDISALEDLTSLTQLSLNSNSISDISALAGLTSLTRLDLPYNSISDISVLEGLTSLRELYLNNNSISDISALEDLTSLRYLYLKGNSISEYGPLRRLKAAIAAIEGHPGLTLDITIPEVRSPNNAPVFTDGATTTRSVAENTASGENIGAAIAATDADTDDTLTYTLSGDPDAGAFRIVSTSGQLQTSAALDYETKSSYTVSVSVSDGNGGSDSITVTITVKDVAENNAPVFTDGVATTRSIAENTASGQNIGTAVAATDADNDTLTYTLGGTDAASFSIVRTSGQLQTNAALDYETKTSYAVTISVSDGKGGSDSITVRINVKDVDENRAPVFSDGASTTRSIAENTALGQNIGAPLAATDADNDTLIYTLGGNTDAASFRIVSTTGQLQTQAALDYETKSSYAVTVSVSDSKGGSDSITVTIHVRDVTEITPPLSERTPQVRNAIVAAVQGVSNAHDVTAAHLAAITSLNLSSKSIRSLKTGDFNGLTALATLDLNTNAISDISALEDLTSLIYLFLSGNSITDISALEDLTSLRHLYLSNNSIRNISALEDLTALTHLYLLGNSITDISALEGLTSLRHLYLHENSISDISALENLTALTRLSLNKNRISDISALEGLTSLIGLNLSHNSISGISALERLTALTSLSLHNNSITDISVLEGLTALKQLDLGKNSIRDISVLEGLTAPVSLNLWKNAISDVSALEHLTSLRELFLGGNPISEYGPLRRLKAAIAAIASHRGFFLDITIPEVTNNAPAFTDGSSATRSVAENTASGENIGAAIAATDADTGDVLTYTIGGTDAASFSIVSTSGQLQTSAALDYETTTSYSVTVSVSDDNGGSDSIDVTISVQNVNEAPYFVPGGVILTVAEDTASGRNIDDPITATDPDNGDTLTYSLQRGDADAFRIDANTGQLQTHVALDFETKNRYTDLVVRATDSAGLVGATRVTIKVTDVTENNAPVFTEGSSATRTIAENTASGRNIGAAIAATDADTDDTLTYSLGGTDAGAFRIVATSGQLQTSAALDYETKSSYSVTVSVSDSNGGSDNIDVTIDVSNVNEAPTFTEGATATRTVAENTASGENIGDAVAATDVDAHTTLVCTLSGTDAAAFSINGTTGQLQTNAALDYETKTSYSVRITVSDGSLTDTIAVTIGVSNVNEAPAFAPGSITLTVAEDTASGTNIGDPITATDPDNGDTLTYSLQRGDAESFRIDANTGQLQTHVALDYETKNAYTDLAVRATDSTGLIASTRVTINVTDNSAPEFTDGSSTTRSVAENMAAGTNIGTPVAATDADNDTLIYTLDGDPDASSFRIVSTTGQLRTRTALDYETQTSYSVTVSVSDSNGGSDSITVTIDVTNVNEAPNFTDGDSTTRSIAENVILNIGTPIAATDPDNDPLTYSLDKAWFGPIGIQIKRPDADWVRIDPNTGQLYPRFANGFNYEDRFNHEAGRPLGYFVKVDVSDGNGGSDSIIVTINVTDVNEKPYFLLVSGGVRRTVAENTAAGTYFGRPFQATDPDIGDTLTYSLQRGDADAFRIDPNIGQLRTHAALDYETKNAYTDLALRVTDSEGLRISKRIEIYVTNVVEGGGPVFTDGDITLTVAENTASSTNIGTPITATDPDIGDTLTYSLQRSDADAFRIDANTGQLRTHAALDYETKNAYTDLAVRATDSEGHIGSTRVRINVTGDSAPVFTDGSSTTRSITENTASGTNIGTPVAATDADNDILTYTLGGTDAAAFSIVSTTGQLQTNAALDYETKTSYSVTVSVSDSNGESDSIDVIIYVGDVNEGTPTFTEGNSTTRSVRENIIPGINIGTPIAATDVDTEEVLTYTLGGDPDAASFSIDSESGQLRTQAVLDFETKSSYSVTVSVSEGRGGSDSIAVTIDVLNVPEAPNFTDGDSATRTVVENTASGENIGAAVAATDDDGDTLIYTLGGTDATSFSIVSTTGQLQTNAALDFESKASYSVTITASDGSLTDSIDVTIKVADVNEAGNDHPTFTEGSSTTRWVMENTAAGQNIGTAVAATDVDTGDTLTYTLGGTDAAAFSIVRTTGQLQTSAALDYDTKSSYSVTVSVSDSNGGSDSITVTINVRNNNAPIFTESTSTTRAVADNTAAGTNIGAPVAATDADNHTLAYSLGGADAASFSIVNTTGQLQTNAALDYDTKSSYSVTVSVSDGYSGSDSIIVTINVLPAVSDRTAAVRDAIVAEVPYVNNADDVTAAHLAAITSLDVSRKSITALKAGDFNGLTALSTLYLPYNSISDISALEDLTSLTTLHLHGNSISDISALEDLTSLTTLFLYDNSISDISALEDLTSLTTLYLGWNSISDVSALEDLTSLTTLFLNSNSISDVSAFEDLTSLTLLYLAHNSISDYGPLRRLKAAISVIAGHPGLTLDFTIPAVPNNNAPAFSDGTRTTRSIAENTAAGTNIGGTVSATDTDTGDTLTYHLGGTHAESFSIVKTSGQLQTRAALDHETKASYRVTVAVSDGKGGTDSINVTIKVTDEAAAAPSVELPPVIPTNTALLTNYPNPFNPETWIPYQLAEPAEVTLTIYDVRGVVVRRLDLGHQAAGVYHSRSRAIHWDGRNGIGEKVASGLYFYTLTAGDFTATRKLLIRK